MWFGGGRGARDAVVALFGSGVGACVVTAGTPDEDARSSALEWGHTDRTGPGPPLPLRRPRLPGGVRGRRGAAASAGSEAGGPLPAGRRRGDRAGRPARRGLSRARTAPSPTRWRSRRPRRDRRVPGRGRRRPDQPLPARTHPHRRLGRPAARARFCCPQCAATPRSTPCGTRPTAPPSSWDGSAPTRSPSAPRPSRWPTSSPAAAAALRPCAVPEPLSWSVSSP